MEADHLEKEGVLTREELEQEREYHQSLIQVMQRRIKELEGSLANQKSLTEDLRKRIKCLEEKLSVLMSMQSVNFNGSVLGPLTNGLVDGSQAALNSGDFGSDKDVAALEMDIQPLNLVKARAAEQRPKIVSLLGSTDYLQENAGSLPSVKKCNSAAELGHKRKRTNSPKIEKLRRQHWTSDGSISSLQDIYGPSTSKAEQLTSSEGPGTHRKAAKPAPRNENLFPPMDVSGVIHTPESGGTRTMPVNRQSSLENFSDHFTPVPTTSQSVKYIHTGTTLATGSQPPQYYNGTMGVRPQINGQNDDNESISMDEDDDDLIIQDDEQDGDLIEIVYRMQDSLRSIVSNLASNDGKAVTLEDVLTRLRKVYKRDLLDRYSAGIKLYFLEQLDHPSVQMQKQIRPGVRQWDINTLESGNCLNDVIINQYMTLLVKDKPKCGAMSSFWYEESCRGNEPRLPKDWKSLKTILAPTYVRDEAHWFLLRYSPHKYRVEIFSSLPVTSAQRSCSQAFLGLINNKLNGGRVAHIHSLSGLAQQENQHDSGVYVCMFARAVLLLAVGSTSVITQEQVCAYREWMKQEIIGGKLKFP